jgi:hypothetical protein
METTALFGDRDNSLLRNGWEIFVSARNAEHFRRLKSTVNQMPEYEKRGAVSGLYSLYRRHKTIHASLPIVIVLVQRALVKHGNKRLCYRIAIKI